MVFELGHFLCYDLIDSFIGYVIWSYLMLLAFIGFITVLFCEYYCEVFIQRINIKELFVECYGSDRELRSGR